MMPPPPLYDSGALPPGIMDNTPRKRPRSNPSFGGVGRGSHLTPSPLGGRPGSASAARQPGIAPLVRHADGHVYVWPEFL